MEWSFICFKLVLSVGGVLLGEGGIVPSFVGMKEVLQSRTPQSWLWSEASPFL